MNFIKYLYLFWMVINIISFIIAYVRVKYIHNDDSVIAKGLDLLAVITAVLFGEFGILIALMLLHQKISKANLLFWVISWLAMVIHVFLYFVINKREVIPYYMIELMNGFEKWILLFIIILNSATFCCFMYDKYAAIHQKTRIPNVTLLLLSGIGGSIGALLGMKLCHHKTNKSYYTLTIPLMVVVHVLIFIVLFMH